MTGRLFSLVAAFGASMIMLLAAHVPAPVVLAKDFDVTGTLDCAERSRQKCDFLDWESGLTLALFTEDITGERMRFEVDASWIRDHLDSFGQDDFVWLVVQDTAGELPVAVAVIEHRCNDGRFPHGQVNQGQSTGQRCF